QNDTIIYVGKAVNLNNRVRSYFREKIGRGPKIDKMVSLIDRFEYIITDTELEALVLENNLIKEYRPKYNTMLRDDKTYPYIKVTVNEPYPRIYFSREMKKDKARYFGPYTSAAAVKDTIDLINKLYRLRTCTRCLPRDCGKGRPCLNYHIGQCSGACTGEITQEQYQEQLKGAMDFLNGNYAPIQKELREKMQTASEAMQYEEAIKYRDLLESVLNVSQKQKIEDSAQGDQDIVALARDEHDAVVQVFFIRAGRMVGREHFYMTQIEDETDSDIMTSFIKQFYAGTPFIPREIMLPGTTKEQKIIEDWLTEKKGSRVYLKTPKIGQKEKLVELAARNAALVLSQDKEKIKREEGRTIGAVREIQELLSLEDIVRMEAYDISNISGFENVGSMVVYEKGKPKRSDYRKFKIRTVAGPDDYACMREVLTRRFLHGLGEKLERQEREENFSEQETGTGKFERFPDLILMDGGRGQVNIALEVLQELKLEIPVCGMVKDDNHRTRGLYYHNREIPIDRGSEGFKLITRIQDEAHRFAIEYHRSLRTKDQVHSVLDDIPGIGPTRRRSLMKAFQSLEDLKGASIEELMDRAALPRNIAEGVYAFFHS
ncbi:MAG: excinuclease ABC subunit UvrC, partial [Lachnospiraceae bacterium]|nr:excinuclease ABC subunit UvrC [Lachnospiraceae bacterium]